MLLVVICSLYLPCKCAKDKGISYSLPCTDDYLLLLAYFGFKWCKTLANKPFQDDIFSLVYAGFHINRYIAADVSNGEINFLYFNEERSHR